jgi:hypothetical protein
MLCNVYRKRVVVVVVVGALGGKSVRSTIPVAIFELEI